MNRKIVYVTLSQFCDSDDSPRRLLQNAGFEVRENRTGRRITREELPSALAQVDAVIAAVEPYAADLLESLPKLRCISRCGIGTDAIDLAAARRLDIPVLTTIEEVVEPVAQMTIAMILALARNFPQHVNDFLAASWKKHTGHLLSEWTIGLIGFGRIGRRVDALLRPFDSKILVSDPALNPNDVPDHVDICSLDRLLAEADLVSIHAGRDAAAGVLFGSPEFHLMKEGSRLVNTSRGYLVNEEALLQSLQSGRLSSAALDVFENEPYDGPLSKLPQVLCTPHVATLTTASRAAMELRCPNNVVEFFKTAQHST